MNGTGLVRDPSRRLADGIVTHISRTRVDVALARAQHAAYADALAASGWTIRRVPVAEDCPDSVFVEDAVVICEDLAVLTRPGAPARRAEVADVAQAVRLEFPSPQVPGRTLPRFGGHPGDPAALVELDHVILPDAAPGQPHRAHVASLADPLPVGRFGQVVVAVPARLLGRIRDQLEDPSRGGRDLAASADHARRLLLGRHAPIQAAGRPQSHAHPA